MLGGATMRFGITYVSIAAVATVVLAAGACGGSGSGKKSGSGAALTADQVSGLLLTDKDEPGWQFSASSDEKDTRDYPATLSAGGTACQSLEDAQNVLSTKYGTTVDVLRTLLQSTGTGSGTLWDDVAVLPSSAKAAAVMSDLAAAVKGCQSFSEPGGSSTSSFVLSADPRIPGAGNVAFTTYSTGGSDATMDITDMVQVGAEVVRIALGGQATHDSATLQQLAATVSHAADVQVSRLKAAQG